jgi:3-dehydroquinate synthase
MTIFSLDHYNIYIGDIKAALASFSLKNYSQVIVICDENTRQYCLPIFTQCIDNQKINIIEIESGEQYKNTKTCEKIWQKMLDCSADRKAIVLNLGGGVIGDMGGFCASTFKRGMDFVQIPTTLLSQVDASVGGKLGIDFQGVKNAIGVFNDPKAVFIDPFFLQTLSLRERRSGFAEIIKHALIADSTQFDDLLQINDLEQADWQKIIPISLKVKQNIVQQDPFEKNVRKALNFGHTIGHAVESFFLETKNPLLHGEAIAIGMICEAFLSAEKNKLSKEALQTITDFIIKTYGKINIPNDAFSFLIKIMQQDKKNESDAINFTFLKGIGQFEINHTATEKEILGSIDFYNQL